MTLRKISFLIFMGLSLSSLSGCGQTEEEESEPKQASPGDQLGITCYSYPYLKAKDSHSNANLCYQPGKVFYGGLIQMFMARDATIEKCRQLNALDNGHKAGPGQSCWNECARVTSCVPLTSQ
jgi:hypothetical protein